MQLGYGGTGKDDVGVRTPFGRPPRLQADDRLERRTFWVGFHRLILDIVECISSVPVHTGPGGHCSPVDGKVQAAIRSNATAVPSLVFRSTHEPL